MKLLAQGKFAEAAAQLDDAASQAMPEGKLAEFWKEAESDSGKFLGQLQPRSERAPDHFAIFVPCRWEQKRLELKAVFNLAGQVSGLWSVLPKATQDKTEPDSDQKGDTKRE